MRKQISRCVGLLALALLVILLGACLPGRASPTPTPSPVAMPAPLPSPSPVATLPLPPATSPLVSLPSVATIVEAVKPAVVAIFTEARAFNIFQQAVPVEGAGSGFIFRPDGYILTNNHVVADAEAIRVALPPSQRFPRGTTVPGKVLGRDPFTDTAVVKVEVSDLPTLSVARQPLRVGDWVIAIGNALALPGGPTVTLGIVSALGRSVDVDTGITLYDLVQTDAAINPGNSGGPLLNLSGEVVGVNSAIASGAQNIGFAVSTATAFSVVEELIQQGKVNWPWIGVRLTSVTPAVASEFGLAVEEGVVIVEVLQGYPAERAGLRQGDVIGGLAGVATPDYETFRRELRRHRAGETVELGIRRGKDSLTLKVTLAEVPATF